MRFKFDQQLKGIARVSTLSLVCAAVALPIGLCGCGKSMKGPAGAAAGATDIRKDLSTLGRAYGNYIDANAKGPADWQSLIDASPKEADVLKRARDAGVTVKWNLTYRKATAGASNTVLAESPNGGPKLMLDGGVAK